MEMLDQIRLAEEITQQCFAVRTSGAFDANGNEVKGWGWSFPEDIKDAKYNFASVLRQKFVEDIFRGRLAKHGVHVHAPAAFVDLEVDETVPRGGHPVIATILDNATDKECKIRCKYLIGADGSRTAVRRGANIAWDGDSTEDGWVRIDGVLSSTDMPKPRSYGAIESSVYGNVLWIPLDHGATRIGYAFSKERQQPYKNFNEEAMIKEAKESVKPFNIAYEGVDWASIYIVGQRVAQKFFSQGCIFLTGDACHTHSSGPGQGMNAGMHDAINLAWKLSLVLRGIAKPALLDTYEAERRPNAQKLINYDEDISVLISKRLPRSWTGPSDANPNVVLGQILKEANGFNTGLTIGYESNVLNITQIKRSTNGVRDQEDVPDSQMGDIGSSVTIPAPAVPGYRPRRSTDSTCDLRSNSSPHRDSKPRTFLHRSLRRRTNVHPSFP